MRNKLLTTLVLALSVSLLSGCGYEETFEYDRIDPGKLPTPLAERGTPEFRQHYPTLEPYEEEVTIKVAAIQYELEANVKIGTTPENQAFNKIAKKYLNINLDYSVVAASSVYDQKINLAIAAGQVPDMFYTTTPALYTSLKENGMLADLSQYVYNLNDELLGNYLDDMPEILPTVMEGGKVYALPALSNKYASAQKLYIRKDWLELLKLQAPTTIAEMMQVGEAFVANKDKIAEATGIQPNRVIPFTMSKEVTWAGSYSAEGIFNAHGASVGSYFANSKDQLECSTISKNAKNALTTLNDMYKKGILDVDFTSKTSEQIQANIKAGYVGMVFGEWWLPKDALDANIRNKDMADWVWVDIPSYDTKDPAYPVVPRVSVSGYNLVTTSCQHPEALVKLINLFYDIYYSDDSAQRYVDDKGTPLTLPANGFYYQFVPVKLWDGVASNREYKRVQQVFKDLYDNGFYKDQRLRDGVDENVLPEEVLPTDYVVGNVQSGGTTYTQIIRRDIIAEIEANSTWKEIFNRLRNREKLLHFLDGYPYYVAYRQNITNQDMTPKERVGWGIYHEMVSPDGSYAYVVNLTEGKAKAKYNEFYGAALSAMTEFGDYLNTLTNKTFTQIIIGEKSIDDFDTFVSDFKSNGGETILEQVNAWYRVQPKLEG